MARCTCTYHRDRYLKPAIPDAKLSVALKPSKKAEVAFLTGSGTIFATLDKAGDRMAIVTLIRTHYERRGTRPQSYPIKPAGRLHLFPNGGRLVLTLQFEAGGIYPGLYSALMTQSQSLAFAGELENAVCPE